MLTLYRITLAAFFSLLLVGIRTAHPVFSSQEPVLEVVRVSCLTADCSESDTWRVFADGTVLLESNRLDRRNAKRTRREQHKVQTKLEPDELSEFLLLAEKEDFLNASSEYVTRRVMDVGSFVKITYIGANRRKQVTVYNYLIANEDEKAKLPSSLRKLLDLSTQVP